jgi:hypothetical protein
VARLSKKRHMYLRRVSPCSCFTIARSMRVPEPAVGVLDRQPTKGSTRSR